jgi:transcriptional regulator with XRE-family HTH domain
MKTTEKPYTRSKLGEILNERGLTLREFAAMVYDKTGYFIAITNLSNYCTGYRKIRTIEMASRLAKTLDVPISDIL